MAKTKISEFSATPANNTDIDGINIAEGCAPSGINDAIRELMAQLKDWQSGTSNDPYVIGSSGSLTLNQGTANGVPYLNGSKVVTSGSALTFDGTNFATTGSVTSAGASNSGNLAFTGTGNRITGDFSNGTISNRVTFQTSTSNSNTSVGAIPNGTASGTNFSAFNAPDSSNASFMRIRVDGSVAYLESERNGTGSLLPMAFYTSGSERMRVDTSGNLGIGTTSTGSARLTVRSGTGTAHTILGNDYGSLYLETASGGPNRITSLNSALNSGQALAFNGSGGTEWMRIDSSGNVGIGTSSPNERMTIASSTSGSYLQICDSSTGTASSDGLFIGSFNGAAEIKTKENNVLQFGTNNTERARIDSSGVLLVGKTTSSNDVITAGGFIAPSGKTVLTTTGTDQPLVLARNNNTGAMIEFYYGGTSRGSVSTNGTTIAYNTSSDYRLKHDIAPMTGALDKVAQLKPVTYKWNSDNSESQGFIAHELQEVVPECVTGEKDATRIEQYEISPAVPATFDEEGNELTPAVEAVMGEREVPVYQGIDTSFLVATLTAAIQELKAEFDAYKATHP